MEFSSTCRVLQWFSVISPKSIVITQWSTQPLLIIHQPILHLNYRASRHFQSPGPNFIGFDVHWLKTWNLYVVTVKFLLTACNCRHFFFTSISIISDWSLFGCLKLLIFKNSSTPGLRSGNFFKCRQSTSFFTLNSADFQSFPFSNENIFGCRLESNPRLFTLIGS